VAGKNSVVCSANTTTGTISSATLAGGVTVDFTGCKSSGKSKAGCTVKSTNTSNAGLIITNTLHGVLGLILAKGTGSGVALLLLPVANHEFVNIAENECTITTAVEGSVAGEVNPVGKSQTTGTLTFLPSTTAGTEGESIKTVDLSTGGSAKPELEAFALPASQETTESLTFSASTEIS
jgi:hypothetical protein